MWPFKQKRFTAEALIDAGPLGLNKVRGRVVAVGDWNGDQNSDLFLLSEDGKTIQIYTWDRISFGYTASHSITTSSRIVNAVPGDFNHDGRLDLLVMTAEGEGGWWGGGDDKTGLRVFLGTSDGFSNEPWVSSSSTGAQPVVYDADGSLRPSLLGLDAETSQLRTWLNNGAGLTLTETNLSPSKQVCTLANPHSSAFVDIDGDCLPDLVLHCQSGSSTSILQVLLNRGRAGFALARSYTIPQGSGPISFADMNRDGSIDIIFPTCEHHSTSSGIGSGCSINIAYSKQVPVCSSEASKLGQDGMPQCRGWGDLCLADQNFEYSFESDSEYFTSIPLSSIMPGTTNLLLNAPGKPEIPLPLRPGDFNVDGFPDLLLTTSKRDGSQPRLLRNVPCARGVAGCDGVGKKGGRGFVVGEGKEWDALNGIKDATGVSWVDLDDDGSLDIMVQRTGDQDEQMITFVQNNFYHDAFFLKAQVLNGACDGDCVPLDGGESYSPLGASYPGATFKFTVLDTGGHRRAQQIVQLPQTSYQALYTPYSFIGLGRTNNYVESLFVGTSLFPPGHTTNLESLIPNSQVIINPPYPIDSNIGAPSSVRARSPDWRTELFLHPGDWVPYVGAAVVATVVVLATVVLWLNEREKKEDEKERRRALHAINFQAL